MLLSLLWWSGTAQMMRSKCACINLYSTLSLRGPQLGAFIAYSSNPLFMNPVLASSLPVSLSFLCLLGSYPKQTTVLAFHYWSRDQLLGKLNLRNLSYMCFVKGGICSIWRMQYQDRIFLRKEVISVMKNVCLI